MLPRSPQQRFSFFLSFLYIRPRKVQDSTRIAEETVVFSHRTKPGGGGGDWGARCTFQGLNMHAVVVPLRVFSLDRSQRKL